MNRSVLAALQPRPGATADAWAARIVACWRASLEAILEVGRLLSAAKETLPHGEFGKMIETQLPFVPRTAQMLMAIADDPNISNPKFISHLPPNWGALYELSSLHLNEEQFESGIEKGAIRPDMDRKTLINGARAVMASRQHPSADLDFSPTPPWATRALIECVFPALDISRNSLTTVHEPACGEGHMAEVLGEYFRLVGATDIYDYGYGDGAHDFLADDFQVIADWIITNPPFKDKAEQFALRAIDQAKVGVAIFARLQWLETIGRYERVFKDQPPTLIAFFCERVALHMGEWKPDGGTATAYIWLVWVKGRKPQAPFWIPPGQREALTHPDDAKRLTAHPVIRKASLQPHDPITGEITESVAAPRHPPVVTPASACVGQVRDSWAHADALL